MRRLNEEFIDPSHRDMDFGALPVRPRAPEVPVIAVDRWKEVEGALHKTYHFRRTPDRDSFIVGLLAYENKVAHNAEILIMQDKVSLKVQTKDIEKATELDREYARYADVLFRDLVHSV